MDIQSYSLDRVNLLSTPEEAPAPLGVNLTNWNNNNAVLSTLNATTEDIEGVTPLMIASMDGCKETTAVLLAHKANVNHVDSHGRTPLIHAVLPVSTKADISLGNVSAATAQRLKPEVEKGLNQYSDVVGTVKLLLEAGADVSIKDKAGKTARDYACDEEVIKLLDAAVAK